MISFLISLHAGQTYTAQCLSSRLPRRSLSLLESASTCKRSFLGELFADKALIRTIALIITRLQSQDLTGFFFICIQKSAAKDQEVFL